MKKCDNPVISFYITGCGKKIYSDSAIVRRRCRLIRAIYFLTIDGDTKRHHRLRTINSLVSEFIVMLCTC